MTIALPTITEFLSDQGKGIPCFVVATTTHAIGPIFATEAQAVAFKEDHVKELYPELYPECIINHWRSYDPYEGREALLAKIVFPTETAA